MGSRQWYRWQTKRTVESCRQLDVRALHRSGTLRPAGRTLIVSWESGSAMRVRVRDDDLELEYTVTLRDEPPIDLHYRVPLNWTPCHYGGERPWLLCPGLGCGRRVAKLYLAHRTFLCRTCLGLVYRSTQVAALDRDRVKAQRIRRRLGGSGSLVEPYPAKPKGMHWRTYTRLVQTAHEADLRSLQQLSAWIDRLERQIASRSDTANGTRAGAVADTATRHGRVAGATRRVPRRQAGADRTGRATT